MSYSYLAFIRSQLFTTLPYPAAKFTDQVIIVTGSNTGLGLEAARHFVRLGAAKVVLAVRNVSKGEAAAKSIVASTQRPGAVEVWKLDLAKYDSVQAFAERAKSLPRLDVMVSNAGIYTFDFAMAEQDESTITVNVVNTLFLGILLLPKLRETSVQHSKKTVLTFTGSFVHYFTTFPERRSANTFEELANKGKARMMDRYNVSKLMELFLVRELANKLSSSSREGRVIVSFVNPGCVRTEIMREAAKVGFWYRLYVKTTVGMFGRTAEEGSRTLLHAAQGADDTHGQYLDDCQIGRASGFVRSLEGEEIQKKLWKEFAAKLDALRPGIMESI